MVMAILAKQTDGNDIHNALTVEATDQTGEVEDSLGVNGDGNTREVD